jgi:transglutaminase-like putative cysteine protease
MQIRIGYNIGFKIPRQLVTVALLEVHPSRLADLLAPDQMQIHPPVPVEKFADSFGNRCCRFSVPEGKLHLWNATVIADSGRPDEQDPNAVEVDLRDLPPETLPFLVSSRYCEVDLLCDMAWNLFGNLAPGWPRVQAICDWVHDRISFGYEFARPTKSARQVLEEQNGVCRDFQHLAITFCRCLNIPARYATGYLGDIGVAPAPYPMDFNAWFDAYLGGRWWTFDARHRQPRIGRVLIATGRDAADVAFMTNFGSAVLTEFKVITEQVNESSVSRYSN